MDCWAFGYEECWAQIHDNFQQKVHVSQQRYDTYVDANPIYKEYLTTDSSTTRFHSCDWDPDCREHEHGLIVIHFKPIMDDQPRLYIHSEKSNFLLLTDLTYDCKPQSRHVSKKKPLRETNKSLRANCPLSSVDSAIFLSFILGGSCRIHQFCQCENAHHVCGSWWFCNHE